MLASGVAGSRGQWVASALFLAGFLPSQSLSLSEALESHDLCLSTSGLSRKKASLSPKFLGLTLFGPFTYL